MSSDGLGIYKTAGTTSRERWKNRAMEVAYIALYTVLVAGMVWWSVTAGLDRSFPRWARWALIGVTGALAGYYTRDLLSIISTFRTDWILHKARKGNS